MIGCIVNTKEWSVGKDDTKIGGGFSDGILPFPKSGTTVVTLQKNKGRQQQSQQNQASKRQSQTRQQQVRQQNKSMSSVHKHMMNPLRKKQTQTRQQPHVRQSQVYTNQPVTSVNKQMGVNPMLNKTQRQSSNNMRHRTYTGQTGQTMI